MNIVLIVMLSFLNYAVAQEVDANTTDYNLFRLSNKLKKINSDSQVLSFRWNAHAKANFYVLQISEYEDFSEILLSRKVKNPTTDVTLTSKIIENPGIYYWRVLVAKKDNRALITDTSSFTVGKGQKKDPRQPSKLFKSFFYSMSQGKTSEKTSGGSQVEHLQNSPLTVGGFLGYRIDQYWSLSSSAYLSYFTANKIEGISDEVIPTPLEYGVNLYGAYRFHKSFDLYVGWDHERLSVFNLDEVVNSVDDPRTKVQLLHYYTVGVSYYSYPFKNLTLIKASLSQSFLNSGEMNKVTDNNLSGYKFILFLQQQLTKTVAIQTFIKNHYLKDENDVKISRYGLGINYSF
jgi:hypothetical protein